MEFFDNHALRGYKMPNCHHKSCKSKIHNIKQSQRFLKLFFFPQGKAISTRDADIASFIKSASTMEIDGISMVREYAEPNMEAAKILRQILLTAKNFAAANSKNN